MKIRTKALVAACAALSATGLASPAAHAVTYTDEARDDVTFSRDGVQVTCTVVGTSSLQFPRYEEGYASIDATTYIDDRDPACNTGVEVVEVLLIWSQGNKRPESAIVDQVDGGLSVGYQSTVRTIPTSLEVRHLVIYECDGINECFANPRTSPK